MFKYICLFMTLVGSHCHAEDYAVKNGINWVKEVIPESIKIEFNNSRIKFDGCRHREYELTLIQPLNERLSFEGGMSYAKGQLQWGISNQKISLKRYSFLPRYALNRKVSLSAGMILQTAPEFTTSQGFALALPKSKIYKMSSRFKGMRDDHQIDIALSSHHWEATGEFGSMFDNGLIDNKVNLNYSAFF